jgi:peptide/nickel transport system substrate-binding protein
MATRKPLPLGARPVGELPTEGTTLHEVTVELRDGSTTTLLPPDDLAQTAQQHDELALEATQVFLAAAADVDQDPSYIDFFVDTPTSSSTIEVMAENTKHLVREVLSLDAKVTPADAAATVPAEPTVMRAGRRVLDTFTDGLVDEVFSDPNVQRTIARDMAIHASTWATLAVKARATPDELAGGMSSEEFERRFQDVWSSDGFINSVYWGCLDFSSRQYAATIATTVAERSNALQGRLRAAGVQAVKDIKARKSNRKITQPWADGSLFPMPNIPNHGTRNLATALSGGVAWMEGQSGTAELLAIRDGQPICRIDLTPGTEAAERQLLDTLSPRAIKTMIAVSRLIFEKTHRAPLNRGATLSVGEVARAMGYDPGRNRTVDPETLRSIGTDLRALGRIMTFAADGPWDPKRRSRPSSWVAPLIIIKAVHTTQDGPNGTLLPYEFDAEMGRNWAEAFARTDLLQVAPNFIELTEGNTLRQDVKFTNGEVFNADAVVTAVEDLINPQKPGTAVIDFGNLKSAARVDDFTVDLTTPDPDPILPERLVHFGIPAPNWLKTVSPETRTTQAVGSGSYLLAEYQKGSHMLFKANPNYWSANKPKIAEIKMVFRTEQAVRGAMLQAGEVDPAYNIPPEQFSLAPRGIIEQTQESPMVPINSEHPVMQDVRVRQAIAEAIDSPGLIKSLYPSGIAIPSNGQIVRQGTLGWNPNLKPYPYNPDNAKRLMQEAGAVGTPVEFLARPGHFPRATEVSELIISWLNQVGFKATVRYLEASAATDAMRAVKPDQQRPDLQMTSASSAILDSSRPFETYYMCGGRNHIGCDPEFDRQFQAAKLLEADARDKALQGLWEYAYDKYWYVPLFGLNWSHGASARLQWEPRVDGQVVFRDMGLQPWGRSRCWARGR